MNTDTGEMKKLQDLTEEELKSKKWVEVPSSWRGLRPSRRLREQKREEYMNRVRDRKAKGELR